MRKNGCFRASDVSVVPSINAYQVGTGIVFGGYIAGFYAVFLPVVENSVLKLMGVVLYGILAVCVAVLDLVCTLVDPSDPNLLRKLEFIKSGREWDDTLHSAVQSDEVCFCVLCKVSVDPRSKHCKACDKCVMGFDHHCKWLNNCIGARNYRPFFLLLTLTELMILCQLGVVLAEFIYCYKEKSYMSARIEDVFDGALERKTFLAIAGVYSLLLFVTSGLLGELYCFHMILWRKQMTTYDYILAERMRKEEEQSQSMHSVDCEDGLRYVSTGGPDRSVHGRSGFNFSKLCRCRRNQKIVAEDAHRKQRSRTVTINPCRLLKTEKVNRLPSGSVHTEKENPLSQDKASGPEFQETANGGTPSRVDESSQAQGQYLDGASSTSQGGPASESYSKEGGPANTGTNHLKPPLPPGANVESQTGGPYGQGKGYDHTSYATLNSPMSLASFASHQESPSAVKITYRADDESEDGDSKDNFQALNLKLPNPVAKKLLPPLAAGS